MIISAYARTKVCAHVIFLHLADADLLSSIFRVTVLAVDSMVVNSYTNVSTCNADSYCIVYNLSFLLNPIVCFIDTFHASNRNNSY